MYCVRFASDDIHRYTRIPNLATKGQAIQAGWFAIRLLLPSRAHFAVCRMNEQGQTEHLTVDGYYTIWNDYEVEIIGTGDACHIKVLRPNTSEG